MEGVSFSPSSARARVNPFPREVRRMKLTKREAQIADRMRALGVYKPEFDTAIRRYRIMLDEYRTLAGKYRKDGYPYESVGSQGAKKSPIVITLEGLRRDLLALEDALGLTPRGLMKMQEEPFKQQKPRRTDGLI